MIRNYFGMSESLYALLRLSGPLRRVWDKAGVPTRILSVTSFKYHTPDEHDFWMLVWDYESPDHIDWRWWLYVDRTNGDLRHMRMAHEYYGGADSSEGQVDFEEWWLTWGLFMRTYRPTKIPLISCKWKSDLRELKDWAT